MTLSEVPDVLESTDVADADGVPLVTVARLPLDRLKPLPVTSRASAYLAGDWVVKSAARVPAREEYRRNLAACQCSAPIAQPLAVVKDASTGHELFAERFIGGTTLASQILEVATRADAQAFDTLYKRIRGPYEALAHTFFVELALAADLKLSNVFETSKGLLATDAWLADCSDRGLKHFSDYHPERSFNHMVLQVADRLAGQEYKQVQKWMTEQVVRLDRKQADLIRRYSKKMWALRATYGML